MLGNELTNSGKRILAKFILVSYAINVHIIIVVSYFNNWRITITLNTFNEGWIELLILPVFTVWAVYTLCKSNR